MSLEQSMTTLAESNLKLAEAMNKYAAVMSSLAEKGVTVLTGEVTAAPAAAADAGETEGKKRGRPAKAEKPTEPKAEKPTEPESDPFADDDDGLGDETQTYTAEQIKNAIKAVKEKKGKDEALGILTAIGVATIGQITEAQYAKVADLCKKAGVSV